MHMYASIKLYMHVPMLTRAYKFTGTTKILLQYEKERVEKQVPKITATIHKCCASTAATFCAYNLTSIDLLPICERSHTE